MPSALLVYPHQLYESHPQLDQADEIFMTEDPLFFGDQHHPAQFHQQKLMLHRASMKWYASFLVSKGKKVHYLDYEQAKDYNLFFQKLQQSGIQEILTTDPTDFLLEKRLKRYTEKYQLQLTITESPNYLTTRKQIQSFFSGKKRYHQTDFYIWQRQRLNLLLEMNEAPLGGKWTYDSENRKKLPRNFVSPPKHYFESNKYIQEAQKYVAQYFKKNFGSSTDFNYPINHQQAREQFLFFLKNRLANYGDFQDAFDSAQDQLFHALLTPALNIGLLSPQEIVEQTIAFYQSNQSSIPLNSLEGFIRQIIGWREFMRALYFREGVNIRTTHFWQHTRDIPSAFYRGNTGITPIDDVIQKLQRTGYAHHIERLMVLGNFMLLCEFDADQVYRWFMEVSIDSYDWVMVPNVYSMALYDDGGLLTTKPYLSSSNYLRKMSHYPKGDWCDIWDGLYWRFLDLHRKQLERNPRMGMMYRLLNKMPEEKLQQHHQAASIFLATLV